MPFPPTLGADQDSSNSAFVATFQAYLAGESPVGDLPVIFATFAGVLDEADLSLLGALGRNAAGENYGGLVALSGDFGPSMASGSLAARTDFPPTTTGSFQAGLLGYVGGVGGADTTLPTPPIPTQGPTGLPTQGAAGRSYPPVLGIDPGAMLFGALFAGAESFHEASYFLGVFAGFVGQAEGQVGAPPAPTLATTNNPAPRAGTNDSISTFQAYLVATPESYQYPLRQLGAFDVVDPVAGPIATNQNNDPAGSQAQIDGEFTVFVGEIQPPFTTSRLPRLAFGPFLNLSGLTYQIELAAFAKFGLSQIKYRIFANDQSAPPFNVIGLTGLNTYVTNLVATLGHASADLHADGILTDAFGNVATVSVVLNGIPDTSSPTAPPFLYIAQLPEGTWIFVWGASSDNFAIDHYQIDQVDELGNPVGVLAEVRQNYFTFDGGSIAGNRYRVLAFDPALNVSASSPIATAIASAAAEPRITAVQARQVPGTGTIQVSWVVDPAGTACTAIVVDGRDRPMSNAVVSTTGQASLTLSGAVGSGVYRVRVGTA
ncbi:hypothetical protein J7643_03770 [bacterium]|nr:hypothetical protein [bacterium]